MTLSDYAFTNLTRRLLEISVYVNEENEVQLKIKKTQHSYLQDFNHFETPRN